MRNIWLSRVPWIGFKVTDNSVLCEKHFSPEDIKSGWIDENSSRRKKKGDKLFRKELNHDAIPSIWPNCPSHLSKPRNIRTTKFATLHARNEKVKIAKKLENEKEIEEDMFSSLGEINVKFSKRNLSNEIHRINQVEQYLFISITKTNGPHISYCLKIFKSLAFEIWCNGKQINPECISGCSVVKIASVINL